MGDPAGTVVGIGELLWDLLPGGPRLGGAPFNVVAHLARFGCRTVYVSAVGRDDRGREAAAGVARLGVATTHLQVNDLPTGVVRVRLDAQGVPDYQIVSPAAYEVLGPLDAESLASVGDVDLLVFGTLAQRFAGTREATRQLAQAARDAPRLYDVNLRTGCWDAGLVERLLDIATVVKLNDDERRVLAGVLGLPASPTERFARALAERYGLRGVCVTHGPAGATLLLDGACGEAPSPPVEVVDTVGAGDAFAAALGYGLIHRWDVTEILSVATRLGALVASREGATPGWELAEIGLGGPQPGGATWRRQRAW